MNTVNDVNELQNGDYNRRVWCASVIIALAIIIRKTGVPPSHDHNTLQVMFPILCLETPQRKYIADLLDDCLRFIAI